MTEAEIIQGIQAAGGFDASVGSETAALRILRIALPHALELPPARSGTAYPAPPSGALAGFQVHPAEPAVGHTLPHVKYVDWTKGKRNRGGSCGHVFYSAS